MKLKIIMVLSVALLVTGVASAKTLSVGSTGVDVVNLQSFLIDNGYPIPLIQNGRASKGYFGSQTRDAVMMYQEANELQPTGSIDSSGYGRVRLGSVSSPDIMSPYFSFGGVYQWGSSAASLIQGSSTVCALQAPAATSTLVGGGVQFTLASTTAVSLDLAKGTTQYATSTKIGSTYTVGASAQATIVASTTGSVAGDGTIFAPSQWFVVRFNSLSASSGAGNAPTGNCHAVWRSY